MTGAAGSGVDNAVGNALDNEVGKALGKAPGKALGKAPGKVIRSDVTQQGATQTAVIQASAPRPRAGQGDAAPQPDHRRRGRSHGREIMNRPPERREAPDVGAQQRSQRSGPDALTRRR